MSNGVNKVIILGNLGIDPEMKKTKAGVSVVNLSIATSESYKDLKSGEKITKTEWHRVSLYDRLAEIANTYLKKGSKVYLEGKLVTRKWVDEKDEERYSTDIIANSLQLLDAKPTTSDSQDDIQI